jgi:hypothetical protein
MSPCAGTVGAVDIVVLNVYVPAGGTGPGGANGAVIDAFNIETGEFCNDDFVTVSPDADGSLTNSGNVLGWVNTQASNETITALGHISPSNMYFKKWEIVDGASQTNHALAVAKNSNTYAFAFYGNIIKQFFKELKEHIKEFKEHKEWLIDKPVIVDTPVKQVPEIKDPKLIREGDPWGRDVWDPGEKLKIQTLIDKISSLEANVKMMGQSFIKTADRPNVGKEISKGTGKAG